MQPPSYSEYYRANFLACTIYAPVDVEPYVATPEEMRTQGTVAGKVIALFRDQNFNQAVNRTQGAVAYDAEQNPCVTMDIYPRTHVTHPSLVHNNGIPIYVSVALQSDKNFGLQAFLSRHVAYTAQEIGLDVVVPTQWLVPIEPEADAKEVASSPKYCMISQFPVSAAQSRIADQVTRIMSIVKQAFAPFEANRKFTAQELAEAKEALVTIETLAKSFADDLDRKSSLSTLSNFFRNIANFAGSDPFQHMGARPLTDEEKLYGSYSKITEQLQGLAKLKPNDFLGINSDELIHKINAMPEQQAREFAEKICLLIKKTGIDISLGSAYFTENGSLAIVDPKVTEMLVLKDNPQGVPHGCSQELSARKALKNLYECVGRMPGQSANLQAFKEIIEREFADAQPRLSVWMIVFSVLTVGLLPLIYAIVTLVKKLKLDSLTDPDSDEGKKILRDEHTYVERFRNMTEELTLT